MLLLKGNNIFVLKKEIILSILVSLIDLILYIKLNSTSSMAIQSNDSYATLGLLISGMFQFGALIYGLGLLLIVWIEYFLISFIIKLWNKLQGLKKFFSVLVLSIISAILLIIFIRIITFIFVLLI